MAKRVYWKVGDREIEVEGDDGFIKKQLTMFFDRLGETTHPASKDLPSRIVAAAKSGRLPSPAEYYRQKKPNGGTETLIVLAKYLEDFRNKAEFSNREIKAIANEAKLKPIHAQYYAEAVKQGLLRNLGKRTYGLSISGEDAVAAMPKTVKA